jgi:taurine transport system substrate-binding protein
MTRSLVVTVLVLSVALLGGVTESEPQQVPMPVRIAYQPSFVPQLYVARELKLFEKAGLAPEYIKFLTGPAMLSALKSGSADIGYLSTIPTLAGLAQGLDVKVILICHDEVNGSGFVVQKDSGIQRLADLRGKKIALARGTGPYYCLKKALQKANLTDKDVTILDMGPPTWVPAFINRNVDGLAIWAPWIYRVEAEGGMIVFRCKDAGIDSMPVPFVATAEFLQKNPEAVQRFIHGFVLADKAMRQNPALGIRVVSETVEVPAQIARSMWADLMVPTVEQMIDPKQPYNITGQGGTVQAMKDQAAFLLAEGFIKTLPDATKAVDPAPLRKYLENRRD